MSLVIYFTNGGTAMFKEVTAFNDVGTEVRFDYFGQSTKVNRKATFTKSNIAGYAIQD